VIGCRRHGSPKTIILRPEHVQWATIAADTGVGMRWISCLVAAVSLVVISSHRSVWAQQGNEVPCGGFPLTLDQAGFHFKCFKGEATAADLEKSREKLAAGGLPAADIEAIMAGFEISAMAPDSITYNLSYHAPPSVSYKEAKQYGEIVLSVAHQGHDLLAVPLRDYVLRVISETDAFGNENHFEWRTHGELGDYETQRFIEAGALLVGGRACFAFGWKRDQSAPEASSKRLLGLYCEIGETELTDAVVTKILSAISVKAP